jgi:gliding motility-associated protein GldM
MAGGKMNARQKMINMMYLVLTALLALNVAKEVLNAFVVINLGLLQQKESLEGKNTAMINQFHNQLQLDSSDQRLRYLNQQALYIQQISDEFTKEVEQMKIDLVVKVDKVESNKALDIIKNPMMVERKDDYDGPTRFFGTHDAPGTDGKANELKKKIASYRENCLHIVDKVLESREDKSANPEAKRLITQKLDLLLTHDPKDNKEYPTWEMQYFYRLPLVAALTELTKWENFVKGAELDMLNFLWEDLNAQIYKFDKIKVAVIPKSNFVTSGSNFEADVFLAAYSSSGSNPPTIVYGSAVDSNSLKVTGGITLSPDQVKNGVGKISIPVSGQGERTFAGTLQLKSPGGKVQTLPFSTKYNVAPPSATVSPDKMNVFYYGLSNPVSISVPGVASNNIMVSATGCTVTGSNGHYEAKPTQQNGNAYISVSARMEDGTVRPMGKYEFRIKRVPTPEVFWGKTPEGSRVPKTEVGLALIPNIPNFEFNVYAVITQYDIFIKEANGSTFSKTAILGNLIPANIQTRLKAANRGTEVYFNNIKMTVPGGTRTTNAFWMTN